MNGNPISQRGWPHSLELLFKKAKGFYSVYAICVAAAAAIVLIPRAPLQLIILGVQVLAFQRPFSLAGRRGRYFSFGSTVFSGA